MLQPLQSFLGPSNKLPAPVVDAEETINLFVEAVTPGHEKAPMWLRGTPGLQPFLVNEVLPTSPVRGVFEQDGRAWAIGGGVLYEVFSDGTVTIRGSVGNDANPASVCSNGSAGGQILIASGGYLYVLNILTNVLTWLNPATYSVPYPCLMVDFMDGYGLALKDNSRQFQISGAEDFLLWDPLDIAERSEGSDNIAALVRSHREIWLFGTKTTEVWYNTGDTFPFAPIQGVFVEQGCPTGAGFTAQRCQNTVLFLTQNENGGGMVVAMSGYNPTRVSSHAIEAKIQSQSTNFDLARAFVYQEEGHTFYLLLLQGLSRTLVYDVATGLWHERGHWDETATVYTPFVGQCHMFAFGKHLVGSRTSGALLDQTLMVGTESLVDSTITLRRERVFPLPFADNRYQFLGTVEVVLQPGLGLPAAPTTSPLLMCQLSRDGGKTFGPERTAQAGPQGAYRQRVRFLRNGSYRNGYMRIAMSDASPWYFVGAYADLENGTS